jgi:hypothetical protein
VSRKHSPPDAPLEEAADLRAALDLWREDTARAAERIDVTGDLADRVVAAAERGHPLTLVPAGARLYAAAAVLLIAVGIAGTLMVRQSASATTSHAVRFVDLEETTIDVVADDPKYAPGLEGR